ncbi:kinesin-like protein KIF22 isoform X1 [Argonauta hians]
MNVCYPGKQLVNRTMESKNRIKVAVRVRPQFIEEDSSSVACDRNTLEIVNHRNCTQNIKYRFTTVFDSDSTQEEVYQTFVAPNIGQVFHGENMSVLAYGATGTGKTYTMIGTNSNPGIVPQALKQLFQRIDADCEMHSFQLKLSFLEIYNEKVKDLLVEGKTELQIREDYHKNIKVQGITEKVIVSYDQFQSVFLPAISQRTTVSSNLNAQSSRSHTILMVVVEKTELVTPFRTSQVGKIEFVDLAGSENNRQSGNTGLRMRESSYINKSLFILHEVVDAIRSGQKRIPYRDSKLTRLIQDSFGGKSSAMLLATVAPEERYYFSTYCTLNFATKSKKIVSNRDICHETEGYELPPENEDKEPVTSSDTSVVNASAASIVSPSSVEFNSAKDFLKDIREKTKLMKEMIEKENQAKETREPAGEKCMSSIRNISKTTDIGTPSTVDIDVKSSRIFDQEKRYSEHTTPSTPFRNGGILNNIGNSMPLQSRSAFSYKCRSEKRKRRYTNMELRDISKDDSILIKHRHMTHKNHILNLLNSENKADILLLHTVGNQRAEVIRNWQLEHGHFKSVEDLNKIPNFGENYVSQFMHKNFLLF